MLSVTESAREQLRDIVQANIDDPDFTLRLVANLSGEFTFTVDRAREDDQMVEHEGDRVLLVGSELGDAVEGLTIDWQETAGGAMLCYVSRAVELATETA